MDFALNEMMNFAFKMMNFGRARYRCSSSRAVHKALGWTAICNIGSGWLLSLGVRSFFLVDSNLQVRVRTCYLRYLLLATCCLLLAPRSSLLAACYLLLAAFGESTCDNMLSCANPQVAGSLSLSLFQYYLIGLNAIGGFFLLVFMVSAMYQMHKRKPSKYVRFLH